MIVSYQNPAHTRVILVDGTAVQTVPVDDTNPVWREIAAQVAAGALVIGEYVAPGQPAVPLQP